MHPNSVELTCWGSRPPSWRRDPRGSSCSWCSRSALHKPHSNAHRIISAHIEIPMNRRIKKKKRRKKIRGAWGACARTRGEDLGGGARVGAADGEAAALELRADLFLHRLRRVACHRRLPGSAGIGFWWGEEKGEREEGGDLGETRGFGGNGGEAKNQNGGKNFAGKRNPR